MRQKSPGLMCADDVLSPDNRGEWQKWIVICGAEGDALRFKFSGKKSGMMFLTTLKRQNREIGILWASTNILECGSTKERNTLMNTKDMKLVRVKGIQPL